MIDVVGGRTSEYWYAMGVWNEPYHSSCDAQHPYIAYATSIQWVVLKVCVYITIETYIYKRERELCRERENISIIWQIVKKKIE